VAYLLPVILGGFGESLWIWPWSGWSDAAPPEILSSLIPVFLALAASFVLSLRRRRLRGALLLLACAASLLVPYGQTFRGLGGNSAAWDLFLRFGWQALALTLGLASISAGNRQQKQSLGRGVGPWVAGLGGLALLAVFFVPVLSPSQRSGIAPASLFLEGEMWARFWPVMIWLVGLIAFGVLGALCPLSAGVGDPLQGWVERGISRLARLLPLALPLILLSMYVAHGFPAFGLFFLLLTKILLHGYAVVILMSIGLARLLDDADPAYAATLLPGDDPEAAVPDHEPAAGLV